VPAHETDDPLVIVATTCAMTAALNRSTTGNGDRVALGPSSGNRANLLDEIELKSGESGESRGTPLSMCQAG